MTNKMTLGNRMKEYYEFPSRIFLPRKSNIIIRVDGKAFHTLTKGCKKPFDHHIITAMIRSARETAEQMQGFQLGYVQSDECSFWIHDKNTIDTDAWFGNNKSKIETITASTFSVHFMSIWNQEGVHDDRPVFDARAFVVPEEEISNYFLWRAKDWERNSLSMYSRAFYSHKELHKKNKEAMHEMLHKKNKNWTKDLQPVEKNGTFFYKGKETKTIWMDYGVQPHYPEINKLIEPRIGKNLKEEGRK